MACWSISRHELRCRPPDQALCLKPRQGAQYIDEANGLVFVGERGILPLGKHCLRPLVLQLPVLRVAPQAIKLAALLDHRTLLYINRPKHENICVGQNLRDPGELRYLLNQKLVVLLSVPNGLCENSGSRFTTTSPT